MNTHKHPHPRRIASLTLVFAFASALALGATACSGSIKDAVSSALPSNSPRPTISVGQPGGGGGGNATEPPQASQAPVTVIVSSKTTVQQSSAKWGWIVAGVILLIVVIALIARSVGRRGATRRGWRDRAMSAYANGAALVDALSVELSIPVSSATTVDVSSAQRWDELERRAGDLSASLHGLEGGASGEAGLKAIRDLEAALSVLRSSVRAYSQASGPSSVPLGERLREFQTALAAFRQSIG